MRLPDSTIVAVLKGFGHSYEWQLGERAKEIRRWISTSRRMDLLSVESAAALRLGFGVALHAGPYGEHQRARDLNILEPAISLRAEALVAESARLAFKHEG